MSSGGRKSFSTGHQGMAHPRFRFSTLLNNALYLFCPCCKEVSGLTLAETEAITRKLDTLYIKFFCPSGCEPTLVINSEKADTRMFWSTKDAK